MFSGWHLVVGLHGYRDGDWKAAVCWGSWAWFLLMLCKSEVTVKRVAKALWFRGRESVEQILCLCFFECCVHSVFSWAVRKRPCSKLGSTKSTRRSRATCPETLKTFCSSEFILLFSSKRSREKFNYFPCYLSVVKETSGSNKDTLSTLSVTHDATLSPRIRHLALSHTVWHFADVLSLIRENVLLPVICWIILSLLSK